MRRASSNQSPRIHGQYTDLEQDFMGPQSSRCLTASDIIYDAVQQEVDLSWQILLAA